MNSAGRKLVDAVVLCCAAVGTRAGEVADLAGDKFLNDRRSSLTTLRSSLRLPMA